MNIFKEMMKDLMGVFDFSGKTEPNNALALCMGDTYEMCGPQKPFVVPAFLAGGQDDRYEHLLFDSLEEITSAKYSYYPNNIWHDD
jgi:hypothetical protein